LAFSILNTPKKLGSSLLRRAAASGSKSTPKGSPRAGTRRSPRGGPTKAPRGKVGADGTGGVGR
ncbi:NUMA1 protein, partial [Rhinopomastus cyanomelas]|nr:NUMA1 protein [Rhinopomastus cyanomelas]